MAKKRKWEYKIDVTTKDYTPDINKSGKEGWELIAVVVIPTETTWQDYKYIFKREI